MDDPLFQVRSPAAVTGVAADAQRQASLQHFVRYRTASGPARRRLIA